MFSVLSSSKLLLRLSVSHSYLKAIFESMRKLRLHSMFLNRPVLARRSVAGHLSLHSIRVHSHILCVDLILTHRSSGHIVALPGLLSEALSG